MTGKPTAAPAIWPYPHRTMAQVMAKERSLTSIRRRAAETLAARGEYDRQRYANERRRG